MITSLRARPVAGRVLAPIVLVAALVVPAISFSPFSGAQTGGCPASTVCAGAASVDMTWHTGAGQGQYGSAGNGLSSGKFDPFHHQTKMVPSDGMQSRLFTKAIVIKGADGQKVAYAKTELYLQQDVLARRVAQLVSGGDPANQQYAVDGLDPSRIMLSATHNHSAPSYVSTAWGVWAFTDTFDFRAFETTARNIAKAIKDADTALRPAKIGASVTRFDDVQQNILGPGTADDGTPAGFPRDFFDDELTVIRIDAVSGGPIAAWVNLGMHPESMATHDLMSADFVGMVERIVERGMGRKPGQADGPVVAWSQGSVGDVEPDQNGRANPVSERREYWHRNVAQAERMSRDVSAAVLDTWGDVAAGTPAVPAKFVPFSSSPEVGMVDYRFPGPLSHPLPTVSNCRTQYPAAPAIGLPDCERSPMDPPEQFGTTIDQLQSAGVPVPDNAGGPTSYGAVQESLTIHLQAIRIGDILVATCPCEPISDMVLNLKSRTNAAEDDIYRGYRWDCRDRAQPGSGKECDFRSAGHLPADWRPVSDAAYARMVAQIENDAAGWEQDTASRQGETEAGDPAAIKGNYTHQEIQDLIAGGGYKLPIMVGQANDYIGYIVTYREFMRGDHYRKALTAFGPHTSDYVNTRLVKMAAQLKGGPAVPGGDLAPASTADDLIQQGKTLAVGQGATVGLGAYEAAIPDDGGQPGRILSQPSSVGRFGAALLTWEGGSNWTDNPSVVVQRKTSGGWQTVATQEGGEVVLSLEYESPASTAPLMWLSGGKTYHWTATFEVFDETPLGEYRFVVDGRHRKGRTANPYHVESQPFDVTVWKGIAAHGLAVSTSSRTATFSVDGVERTETQLETDEDGVLAADEIHYPDTYTSPVPYIKRSYANVGSHTYCWNCTFRPWANTSRPKQAEVTVLAEDGTSQTYNASFDGSAWKASGLELFNGDVVVVRAGGVVDEFGNINGEESNRIGPLTGLTNRTTKTALTYTGATSGIIDRPADVSATLKTASGAAVQGMTITFTRGTKTATAVTDADGKAATTLAVEGPPGTKKPLVASFAGTDRYLASKATVTFNAVPAGKAKKSNNGLVPVAASAGSLLGLLLLLAALSLLRRRRRPKGEPS